MVAASKRLHNPTPTGTMSRIELAEGLVILPSQPGAAGQVSAHSNQSGSNEDGLDALRLALSALNPGSPDTASSSAIALASSLQALRNDSGEAVWRLTEKALEHFESCRVRLGQEAFRIELGQSRGSAECASVGTGEASCD